MRIRIGGGAKTVAVILGVAGAALFTALIVRTGLGEVAAALGAAGWGIVLVALFHIVPLAADTASWMCLIDRPTRPPYWRVLVMRWICGAVNTMLPAAQIGGDIVRARLLVIDRVPGQIAAASVLADLTLGILSQAVFTVLGLALLLYVLGEGAIEATGPVILGVVVGMLIFAAFYGAQRLGLFSVLARLVGRMARSGPWVMLVERAETFDRTLEALYRRRRDVVVSFLWTLLSWVLGSGEVWLAFWVLGSPITVVEALILESVAQAVRSAMFLVPGALGVLEGGLLLAGGMLGLPVETTLAMALVKRVRELVWGIPGLLLWQIVEGRRAWRRSARDAADPPAGTVSRQARGGTPHPPGNR